MGASAELLAAIEELGTFPWSGTAYRHTAPNRDSLSGEGARLNGARWNERDGSATIYLASPEATCHLELRRLIERQGSSVRFPRVVHTIAVEAVDVLDLSTPDRLAFVGLDLAAIEADDWSTCQTVGEAAAYLGYQGVLAPSAAEVGYVLAVFEQRVRPGQLILLDSSTYDYPEA